MWRVAVCLLALGVLLGVPVAVSAGVWEPEREYAELAVDPADDVRYGGYAVGDRVFVDVLDRSGEVSRTIQLNDLDGFTTTLYDLDTSGELLIVSYRVSRGDPFFETVFFALSLFKNSEEIARGLWSSGNPYAGAGKVALNDESVFLQFSDTGVPEGPYVVPIADIPTVTSIATDVSDFETIPIDWEAEFDGDRYPGAISMSASNEFLYLFFDREYRTPVSVDVYSLPDLEFVETVLLGVSRESDRVWAADHLVPGGFVVFDESGVACSISTYSSNGRVQDCFESRSGDPERDPFGTDACGGIVVADARRTTDHSDLTGFKFIPSTRDPGCFVDSLDSTFIRDIEYVGRSGISRGCNPHDNDRFCPNEFVTRGQMAAFLARALSLPPTLLDIFSDDDDSIFEADINRLAAALVTFGCGTGGNPWTSTYCPNEHVTRGQMAAFLVRAVELPTADHDHFTDDNGSIFEDDINRLAEAGITKGCNPPADTEFCADEFLTRGQMAAFLNRALATPVAGASR